MDKFRFVKAKYKIDEQASCFDAQANEDEPSHNT
jgi:hypothetical protein